MHIKLENSEPLLVYILGVDYSSTPASLKLSLAYSGYFGLSQKLKNHLPDNYLQQIDGLREELAKAIKETTNNVISANKKDIDFFDN